MNTDDLSSLFEKFNIDKNSISPDMINNIMDVVNNSNNNDTKIFESQSNSQSDSSNSNIDFDTILKMKSIIDKMNTTNNPRANLLKSLKPYLKETRRNKIDQYIQLMNISSIIEDFNHINGEGKNVTR